MPNIKRGMMGAAGAAGDTYELFTWGDGNSGRTGHGNTTDYSSPVQVGALKDWMPPTATQSPTLATAWAETGGTTMAVKTDGTLWGWGENTRGQIGDNTMVDKSSPVQVGSLTDWSCVDTGDTHTVAIKTDGTLWTWGYQLYGALGNGSSAALNISSPVQVGSLTNWLMPSSLYYSSGAIKTDGTLWLWGRNLYGGLATGNTTNYSSPVQVGSLTNWAKLTRGPGKGFTGIKTDGTLWTWGEAYGGSLGDGTTTNKSSPVQVGSLTNWSECQGGRFKRFAIKTDGTLWAWGYGVGGGLGLGSTTNYSSPVQVGSLTNWSSVLGVGYGHAMVVKTDGTLWAWGANGAGALGIGNKTAESSPVQVGSETDWVAVSCGAGSNQSTAALRK